LQKTNIDGIEYRICSAEAALSSLPTGTLILYLLQLAGACGGPFCSALRIHRVLKDDGVMIGVMPAVLESVPDAALYSGQCLVTIERITKTRG